MGERDGPQTALPNLREAKMNLFDAIEKVKNALSGKDYIAELTHFHLKGGEIFAANGAMSASCPIDEVLEHVVPADELLKAMAIFGRDAQYIWSEETLTVKKAKRKLTVRLLKPDNVYLIEPVASKTPVPSDFIDRMKTILPFVSDDASRPWALTAWLHRISSGRLVWTATNNITAAEADATLDQAYQADKQKEFDCQIPNFALEFLIQRKEGLVGVGQAENRVTFFFADGSKMTTQLFVVKMALQVSDIVQDSYNALPTGFRLTPEWRAAYNSLLQLSPEEVCLGDTTMTAAKRQAVMEVEVASPIPQDTSRIASYWNPKFLTPVVEAAHTIDFSVYPQPARFQGDGIRGIICAKNK